MRFKILTVDDSKTVRIIVKKAFKSFDCDIVEAANGVEGLGAASREKPDLILLDITMPVMDGVEMLTKIKADPELKGIPVIMLTAEGGRDNVLKIAKIGVRDYIVKPFKEEVLIEKCGRVIALKPLTDGPIKTKTIFDAAIILIVEDKPAIVSQIQEGLKHTPWKFHGVSTPAAAVEFCNKTPPDAILISLTLPEEASIPLFRQIRQIAKQTPIFGLVVKTDLALQLQGQQVGFSQIITKPIDNTDLEARLGKAMNLDTSQRYFRVDGDVFVIRLPANTDATVIGEVSGYLKPKIAEAVDSGIVKAVIDLLELKGLNSEITKLLIKGMATCKDLALQYTMVGNSQIISECKSAAETRNWQFHASMADAKASFAKGAPSAHQTAGVA